MDDMRDVGNRQQGNLRTVKGTATRRRPRPGARTTGFLGPVVGTGGLVQQFGDFGCLHRISPLFPVVSQLPCQR
jgi:hypothetical protein